MKPELTMMMNLIAAGKAPGKASMCGKNAAIASAGSAANSLQQKNCGASIADNAAALQPRAAAFKKIVESVIKANKRAQAGANDRLNGQTTDAQALAQFLQNSPISDVNELYAFLQNLSPDIGLVDAQNADQAVAAGTTPSSLVQNALAVISHLLHLNVAQGFQDVNLNNPSDGLKDQLAEVLTVLKGIDGLLTEALRANQSLTINNVQFDPTQIAFVEKTLRVETFHIELALSMAGISSDVAKRLTDNSNQSTQAGILSATTPATISASESLIAGALGKSIDTKDATEETELKSLAATLKQSASSLEKSVLQAKIATIATKTQVMVETAVQAATVAATQAKDGPVTRVGDQSAFDAKTMRAMLKIDTVEVENKAAASGAEKIRVSDASKTLFAKNLNAATELREVKTAVFQADAGQGQNTAAAALKASDAQPVAAKTLEESVITQLAEKVQTAVKTGATEIRLLLRPESLGEMRVKLTLDGDVVMGKIYVENQQVKHIIETNMQSLKDSLAQHNLQTGTFDVDVGGHAKDFDASQSFAAAPASPDADSRRHDEAEKRQQQNMATGLETGRKYGSNTVEYFA